MLLTIFAIAAAGNARIIDRNKTKQSNEKSNTRQDEKKKSGKTVQRLTHPKTVSKPEAEKADKVEVPQTTLTPAQVTTLHDISKVIDGEWVIRTVGATTILREENAPYIYFVLDENRFYASNGCNVLNGVFTIDATNRITFHNVLSTMKYCSDTPYDTEINEVFKDERTVTARYENIAGEGYLYLMDKNGKQLMTLNKNALGFLNGNWQIAEINGQPFDDEEMTVFFDINERKIHGNTGCNYFNGNIFVDPNKANIISLSNMGVTQRMCPNLDLERQLLVALEEISVVVDGLDGTALLTDTAGTTSIKLVKMNETLQSE